jgi:drug/metabolite transporter (DMT)-like permease
MKLFHAILLLLVLTSSSMVSTRVLAQGDLEHRVSTLEHSGSSGGVGVAVFVCGAFCALWAQNTGRNPWLWFFLGLFFNVITVLVLLRKNANDKRGKT